MPDQLQLRGGTTTEHNSFTGVAREVTVDTTKKTLVVHDGSTAGGTPLMRESGGNAASAVSIGTGGNNVINIDSSQQVGIGTANISNNLHVHQDDSDKSIAQFTNTTTGTAASDGFQIGITSGEDALLNIKESKSILFKTADTERMRIDANGNVRVGDSSINIAGVGAGPTFAVHGAAPEITLRDSATGNPYSWISTDDAGSLNLAADQGNNANSSVIKFRVDGSEKMRIDASGNVGIGTTSQQNPLTVAGNGDTAIDIVADLDNNGANNWPILNFRRDSVSGTPAARIYQKEDDNAFVIDNNGSEKMRIDSSGRLLVGTTTEGFGTADDLTIATSGDTGITIRSGTSNKGNIFFSDSTSGTDEFKGQVQYDHDIDALILHSNASPVLTLDSSGRALIGTSSTTGTSSSADDIVIGSIGDSTDRGITLATSGVGSIRWADADDNAMGRISYSNSSDYMFFATNNQQRMGIDSSGNVGIGITNPDQKLHVRKGDAGGVDSQSSSVITLENSDNATLQFLCPNNKSAQLRFGDVQDNGVGYIDYDHNQNRMSFATNGPEKMRIDSSGNVGIGTTSPVRRLHLNGSDSDTVQLHITNSTTGTTSNDGISFALGSDESLIINQRESNHISLKTADEERIRIDADGLTSIGTTTTANARLFVNPNVDSSTQRGITISGRKDVYDVIALNFVHATNNSSAGSVTFTTTAAVAYNTTSDYRLKQDVVTLTDSITKLKQLNPVHFKWKDMPSVETDGLLAHEVQTVVPSAITGEKDALDKNGNIEPQQIEVGKLTPLLTSALQEAIAKIETLETKVAALEAA